MCDSKRKTVLGAGRHLRLVADDGWEYVERTNATGVVVVAAVTEDRKLVLTEQYRRPVNRRVIDLAAGLAGDVPGAESEDLATAAKRELLEETGFAAGEMVLLAEGPSSAGLTSEVVTFFLATDLTKVGPGGGDTTEDINVHLVPLDSVDDWLSQRRAQGLHIDPKIYLALYFCRKGGPLGPASR